MIPSKGSLHTILVFAALAIFVCWAGCIGGQQQDRITLHVVAAGSLLYPFEEIEREFERLHPDVDVQVEGHGSIQAIRQVTDIRRSIDVVAVADESLIPDLMYRPMESGGPNFTVSSTPFACNAMVIAFTNQSLGADVITGENWPEILRRPDVRVGISNPMLDAAGYRGLMVLMLADREPVNYGLFNAVIGDAFEPPLRIDAENGTDRLVLPEVLRPKSSKVAVRDGSIFLLSLLDTGGIDYAFEYRSVAEAHGLRWIDLPSMIDLSTDSEAARYSTVQVQLGFQRFASIGSERTGRPIVYAVTVPATAPQPQLAEEFASFVAGSFQREQFGWPRPLIGARGGS
jgi:molybdate/tungstate transport system substrate-binding protein